LLIPDPDPDFLPIPDPGVKKAPDPRVKKAPDPGVKKAPDPGSATLVAPLMEKRGSPATMRFRILLSVQGRNQSEVKTERQRGALACPREK
jgi:hypothetical protein